MSLENLSHEAIEELASLSKRLSEDPKTRREFLKLTKQVHPDLPVPEIEIEERTNSLLSKAEQRVQNLEAKLREKDAKEELQRRRNTLKDKGLIQSEEDIREIEKVMVDRGIANHETAAEYWQWMKQAAAPTPTGYPQPMLNRMNITGFMKNPVATARNEAALALNELRKNPKPIGL